MIALRDFQSGDEPALRAVFESAIHGVAIRNYTPRQVDAWAPREHDPEDWVDHMQDLAPFVAERDGEIVGGVLMRRLLARADELGLAEMTSNVSLTAQPFFAHFGFEVVEHRVVDMRGVALHNAAMRKRLR